MSDFSGILVGLIFAIGVLLIVSAFMADPEVEADRPKPAWQQPTLPFEALQLAIGVIVGFTTLFLVGWPIVAIFAGLAAVLLPKLLTSNTGEAQFAEKTDAVAAWIESLRDTMRAARGIEGALDVTAERSPPVIRADLIAMNQRIAHGQPVPDALVRLADDVNNPVLDMVVAVLVEALLHSADRAPSILDKIADSARERAHAHLQVHTSRTRSRTTLRLVLILIAISVVGFFFVFNSYLEPLKTSTGQVFVGVVLIAMSGCLGWIWHLSQLRLPARVIEPSRALASRNYVGVRP